MRDAACKLNVRAKTKEETTMVGQRSRSNVYLSAALRRRFFFIETSTRISVCFVPIFLSLSSIAIEGIGERLRGKLEGSNR